MQQKHSSHSCTFPPTPAESQCIWEKSQKLFFLSNSLAYLDYFCCADGSKLLSSVVVAHRSLVHIICWQQNKFFDAWNNLYRIKPNISSVSLTSDSTLARGKSSTFSFTDISKGKLNLLSDSQSFVLWIFISPFFAFDLFTVAKSAAIFYSFLFFFVF